MKQQKYRQGLWALLLFVMLSACEKPAQIYALNGQTMGTTWSVKLVGMPAGVTAETIRSDIELVLESVNNQMSTYRPDSYLSQFNMAPAESWHAVPADLFFVVDYAVRLAEDTQGYYDPTVGLLVNLWGFGPDKSTFSAPTKEEIELYRARVGWQHVELDYQEQAIKQSGGVYVDLSSVAKGFAVDKIATFLKTRGFDSFLVEVGGELRAEGLKPGQLKWQVAVEKPDPATRSVHQVVELSGMSIASSGDYRNFFEHNGKLYSHTINPLTGYPVEHPLASVTVLHQNCMEADALATALLVLGPDAGFEFAVSKGLPAVFWIRGVNGAEDVVKSTPAMADYIH